MIAGRRVLAVVPARGGSKGVPRKNLRPVGGVPLVARVGHVVAALDFVDRAVVSTDDDEIAATAERAGLAAPFRRPVELSGDRVGDVPVLTHALRTCEEIDGVRYDIILMLQPTSPCRTADDVAECTRKLVDGEWDSVWTVDEIPLDHHPLKQLTIDGDDLAYFAPDGVRVIARQELRPTYARNGAAYAFTRACLVEQGVLLGARASAVRCAGARPDIDSEEDLARAERVLRERGELPPSSDDG